MRQNEEKVLESETETETVSEVSEGILEEKAKIRYMEQYETGIHSATIVDVSRFSEDSSNVFSVTVELPTNEKKSLVFTEEDLESDREELFLNSLNTTISELDVIGKAVSVVYRNDEWFVLLEEYVDLSMYETDHFLFSITSEGSVITSMDFIGLFSVFWLLLVVVGAPIIAFTQSVLLIGLGSLMGIGSIVLLCWAIYTEYTTSDRNAVYKLG